jgi:hypothetical protein
MIFAFLKGVERVSLVVSPKAMVFPGFLPENLENCILIILPAAPQLISEGW